MNVIQNFPSFGGQFGWLTAIPTLSMRDSSMLLEYSFSLKSSRSILELSMSADRWGMLDTHATVRSLAGVGGLRVDGDWEPWKKSHKSLEMRKYSSSPRSSSKNKNYILCRIWQKILISWTNYLSKFNLLKLYLKINRFKFQEGHFWILMYETGAGKMALFFRHSLTMVTLK